MGIESNAGLCGDGFTCFQRKGGEVEKVPGCVGGTSPLSALVLSDTLVNGRDYCVRDDDYEKYVIGGDEPWPIKNMGRDHVNPNMYLKRCEGDCDETTGYGTCQDGLVCLQRISGESIPGCEEVADAPVDGLDYCVRKEDLYGDDDWPVEFLAKDPGKKLRRCQGDCDRDSHCKDDLICYERDGTEEIPGCSGGLTQTKGYDFCIRPGDLEAWDEEGWPIKTWPEKNPVSHYPLKRCQGDCDRDSHCEGNLVCFEIGRAHV